MRGRGRTGMLGTFGGVFTPSLLTILGVVLFLRTGFVVGSARLGRVLSIFAQPVSSMFQHSSATLRLFFTEAFCEVLK